jgi:hypothetical protein
VPIGERPRHPADRGGNAQRTHRGFDAIGGALDPEEGTQPFDPTLLA